MTAIALVSLSATARADLDVNIEPVSSGDYTYKGDSVPAEVRLAVDDARQGERPFIWGKWEKGKSVRGIGAKFPNGTDALAYFTDSVAAELSKHGIPTAVGSQAGKDTLKLRVEAFDIKNRQAQYGPHSTFAHLRMIATYKGESKLVTGYVVHAKVIKRRNDPTALPYLYGDAIHLLVREAVAKLNRAFSNLSVASTEVDKLIAAVPEPPHTDTTTRLADVASTNHARATEYLGSLVDHPNQPTRRTAIWGLGLLGSNDAVATLRRRAIGGDSGDLLLAMKSLADIGTPEARSAMKAIEDVKRPKMKGSVAEELDALRDLFRDVESQEPPVGVVAAPVGVGAAPATVAAAQEDGCFPLCRSGYTCDPTGKSCVPTAEAPPPPATARDDACLPPCRVGFVCDQSRGECVQETTAAPP